MGLQNGLNVCKGALTKNLRHAYRILAIKGVGGGGGGGGGGGDLSESIKKGKFVTKTFFSDNVEWSSKNLWKMISAHVKANIKQGIKQ